MTDREMLKQADEWLKSMLEIASEQKEAETIEHMKQRIKVQKWLMKQAERVWELEKENIGLKQDLKNVTEQLESVSDVVWKGDSDE